MISITNPANISTPVMTNMGIMAARGKTNAATIGAKAESTTLNHGSIRGVSCSASLSLLR